MPPGAVMIGDSSPPGTAGAAFSGSSRQTRPSGAFA
jgi:hypothetical protein